MTREEQIIDKGIEYTLMHYPVCLGGDSFSEAMREFNRNKTFEAGAKWADEHPVNFWFGVETEPLLDCEEIIYIDDVGHAGICSMFGFTFGDMCWGDYAKHHKITKWTYIKNLLPKID